MMRRQDSSQPFCPCVLFVVHSGIGITVGAHRLWSHRSFQASWPLRFVLMLCNSVANQGSIYHWVRDHRVHHKCCETEADPYDASRGFFFSHIGWVFVKKNPAVIKAGKDMDFTDLMDDPIVRWQHYLHPWFNQYMCFVLPAQIATKHWDEDFYTAFLVAGMLRYCWVLHCTFLVNSAAHMFGDQPYDSDSNYATENPIVSFLSIGEGWHNWHHKYPYDYSASEFGISSQFNPTKLFIDCMATIGFVWGQKRATSAWTKRTSKTNLIQKRRVSKATT